VETAAPRLRTLNGFVRRRHRGFRAIPLLIPIDRAAPWYHVLDFNLAVLPPPFFLVSANTFDFVVPVLVTSFLDTCRLPFVVKPLRLGGLLERLGYAYPGGLGSIGLCLLSKRPKLFILR
jgi:hypothetical protein